MKNIVEILKIKKDQLKVHDKQGSREWCVFEANHKRYIIELENGNYRFQVAQYSNALLEEIIDWVTVVNTSDEISLLKLVTIISEM